MRAFLYCWLLSLAACAADPGHSSSRMSDGTMVHTIRCEENWDACYLAASRICDGEFEEVARDADHAISSAGRLERMHSTEGGIERQRYSENVREASHNRVLMIRCVATR